MFDCSARRCLLRRSLADIAKTEAGIAKTETHVRFSAKSGVPFDSIL
jgi:hypothetical protein